MPHGWMIWRLLTLFLAIEYIENNRQGNPYMPSVDEYSDPEEFYYWNIDIFYDYVDAEEYYYSHGGR